MRVRVLAVDRHKRVYVSCGADGCSWGWGMATKSEAWAAYCWHRLICPARQPPSAC